MHSHLSFVSQSVSILDDADTLSLYELNMTGTIPTEIGRFTNARKLSRRVSCIFDDALDRLCLTLYDRVCEIDRIFMHESASGKIPTEFGLLTDLSKFMNLSEAFLGETLILGFFTIRCF